MQALLVKPCEQPLVGRVPVFDDQPILLARIALAALCRGRTRIDLAQVPGASAEVLLRALELLGIKSETRQALGGTCELDVQGQGLLAPLADVGALDVRGESAVAGLLVGLLAGRPGSYELLVDEQVAAAVSTFLLPLGALEQKPASDGGGVFLHLRWAEGKRIPGFEISTPGLASWHKQAALLTGLRAAGETSVLESIASSDHLERALSRARAPIEQVGSLLVLHPPRDADALRPDHFGPIGSAHALGYLAALALSIPGSHIEVRGVSTNPSGPAVAAAVQLLGGGAVVRPGGDVQGEPVGDVAFFGSLGGGDERRGLVLSGETAVHLGDAVFPLLVAAARGQGRFEVTDLAPQGRGGDLRIIERVVGFMRSAGASASLGPLSVLGQAQEPFRPLRVTTGGDGRLAALGTLMAMASREPSVIDDVDCLRSEFPRFIGTLKALGASLEMHAA